MSHYLGYILRKGVTELLNYQLVSAVNRGKPAISGPTDISVHALLDTGVSDSPFLLLSLP
jgi:hypothetical protein